MAICVVYSSSSTNELLQRSVPVQISYKNKLHLFVASRNNIPKILCKINGTVALQKDLYKSIAFFVLLILYNTCARIVPDVLGWLSLARILSRFRLLMV